MTLCKTMFSLEFSVFKTPNVCCQKRLPEMAQKPCALVSDKTLKACAIISYTGK